MYRTISEFIDYWTKESVMSLKVLRAITDPTLQQK